MAISSRKEKIYLLKIQTQKGSYWMTADEVLDIHYFNLKNTIPFPRLFLRNFSKEFSSALSHLFLAYLEMSETELLVRYIDLETLDFPRNSFRHSNSVASG